MWNPRMECVIQGVPFIVGMRDDIFDATSSSVLSLASKMALYISIFLWRCDPTRVMAYSFTRFSRSHTTTHHSR